MKHLEKYTYHQLDISFSFYILLLTTNLNINFPHSIFRNVKNYVKYMIYYNFILHKAFDIKLEYLKKKITMSSMMNI